MSQLSTVVATSVRFVRSAALASRWWLTSQSHERQTSVAGGGQHRDCVVGCWCVSGGCPWLREGGAEDSCDWVGMCRGWLWLGMEERAMTILGGEEQGMTAIGYGGASDDCDWVGRSERWLCLGRNEPRLEHKHALLEPRARSVEHEPRVETYFLSFKR